jgi:hypothetical protein
MAEEQEDFSKLPLADRFVNKNWKVRKEAYEAATKEFKTAQPSDPLVKDFTADSNIWKGAVADANVAAQAEGLNALNAFLEIAGKSGCTRCATLSRYSALPTRLTHTFQHPHVNNPAYCRERCNRSPCRKSRRHRGSPSLRRTRHSRPRHRRAHSPPLRQNTKGHRRCLAVSHRHLPRIRLQDS